MNTLCKQRLTCYCRLTKKYTFLSGHFGLSLKARIAPESERVKQKSASRAHFSNNLIWKKMSILEGAAPGKKSIGFCQARGPCAAREQSDQKEEANHASLQP